MSFVSRIWKCCSPQWGKVTFTNDFRSQIWKAAVHNVAQLGLKLNDSVIWLEECPTDICNEIRFFYFFNNERIWCQNF